LRSDRSGEVSLLEGMRLVRCGFDVLVLGVLDLGFERLDA
jgi:hypothetical protein